MKRKADDDPTATPFSSNVKLERPHDDTPAPDYAQDVKKKTNARAGQACDRCKVRKMRCDDNVNGCAPCSQNHSECKTTDRITGKATVRGYLQSIERRNQELENYIHLLQSRLASLGDNLEGVRLDDKCAEPATSPLLAWHDDQTLGTRQAWDCFAQETRMPSHGPEGFLRNMINGGTSDEPESRLPYFRDGLAGNNYLGVSTGNSLLSSIRGTSMNVLGMEIDLADYMSPDLDEPDPARPGTQPVYNKSYRAFVQTAFGISPKLAKVELPPKCEGMEYAKVYFRVTNPYLPIVHKPSFMATLERIYDDPTFAPSVAETVMVHTMFAIMHCQYATRAPKNAKHQMELNHTSNFHYHYALGFFAQLVASHTLADVQALTMLCLHIRNLPKPGPCWMITSIVLDLAIELGLHRSAQRWAPLTTRSVLEIEIRKRVFWSLLVIHVIVAGNLGRPVALRTGDWDVELPEAVDDNLLSENGIDTSRPGECNFLVGSQLLAVVPIYMDLFSSIYAVKRSPRTYVPTVLGLEKRIREWQEHWPAELKLETATDNELGRVHAQYLAIWPLHIRLLLRHPSLSLATEPEFNSENLTICMEVSHKMLHHVKQLQRYKSLDGTWQTGALYVLAVATTLFGHWERRDQMRPVDLARLKADMESWLSIIGDMSYFLGSGRKLQDAVRIPVENTLSRLTQHLATKAFAFTTSNDDHYTPPGRTVTSTCAPTSGTSGNPSPYESYATSNDEIHAQNQAHNSRKTYPPPPQSNETASPSTVYSPQYVYSTPYPITSPTSFQASAYPSTNALPATAAAATAYLNNYAAQTNTQSYPPNTSYTNFHNSGSPTSWRTWAGNMASNFEPGPEYMSSASALMQLGGRGEENGAQSLPPSVDMQLGHDTNQTWPFNIFEGSPGGGSRI